MYINEVLRDYKRISVHKAYAYLVKGRTIRLTTKHEVKILMLMKRRT